MKFPSPAELTVMRALGRRAMYGLRILDATRGAVTEKSIYVLLNRLTDKGYVTREDGARPLYSLTPNGKSVVRMARETSNARSA